MERLIECKSCGNKFNVDYYGHRFNKIVLLSQSITYELKEEHIGGHCPICNHPYSIKESTLDEEENSYIIKNNSGVVTVQMKEDIEDDI